LNKNFKKWNYFLNKNFKKWNYFLNKNEILKKNSIKKWKNVLKKFDFDKYFVKKYDLNKILEFFCKKIDFNNKKEKGQKRDNL